MKGTFIIGNTLEFPGLLFNIIRNVNRQKKFIEARLGNELKVARQSADGSLADNDFKKITGYYALGVPAILCEAFCVLRGEKMSLQERLACTYQGAMTGLGDDFFDKQNMSDELVKNFIEKPGELTGNNASNRLFLEFYRTALQNAFDPQLMLNWLLKVFRAQIESKKQAAPGLTKDEIQRITINKGGLSVLFYRSVFAHSLSVEEEEALYKLGGMMQLANDIFDVYKDHNSGIETLVTTAKHINDVRMIFNSIKEDGFGAIYRTKYERQNIQKFLNIISLAVCSRCYVCLDQLERNEQLTNNQFSPHLYSREQLVCDMDKAGNKVKTVLQHIRTAPPSFSYSSFAR